MAFRLLVLFLAAVCPALAQPSQPPAATSAAPAALSLEAYIASLDKVLAQTESADLRKLTEVSRSLPANWRVTHRGQTAEITMAWLGELVNTIQARPKEEAVLIERGRRRLQHMRDEAQAWLETEPGGIGSAQDSLNAILSRSEFGAPRGPTWLDRLRARIYYWLERIIGGLMQRLGFSMVGGAILWSIIALSVIVVVLWAVRALRRRIREPELDLKHAAPEKLSWRRWAQRALAAAKSGDHRAAIHHAYWASIFRLEEMGAWQMDRARTHREYLRLLPAQHEQRENLIALTRRFESVWYGRQPATADDFREATASLEKLGCLLGSMPATANS